MPDPAESVSIDNNNNSDNNSEIQSLLPAPSIHANGNGSHNPSQLEPPVDPYRLEPPEEKTDLYIAAATIPELDGHAETNPKNFQLQKPTETVPQGFSLLEANKPIPKSFQLIETPKPKPKVEKPELEPEPPKPKPKKFDLIPAKPDKKFGLIGRSEREREKERPTFEDERKTEFWEGVHRRINYQGLINDYLESRKNPKEGENPLDRLNDMARFSFVSFDLAQDELQRDRYSFNQLFTFMQQERFDLDELERRGYLYPDNGSRNLFGKEYVDNPKETEEAADKMITEIEELIELQNQYAKAKSIQQLGKPTDTNPQTILNTIKDYFYSETTHILDHKMFESLAILLPAIKQDLIKQNLLPNTPIEQEKTELQHEEAAKFDYQSVPYEVRMRKEAEDRVEVINEANVREMLATTIPGYFHGFIDGVEFSDKKYRDSRGNILPVSGINRSTLNSRNQAISHKIVIFDNYTLNKTTYESEDPLSQEAMVDTVKRDIKETIVHEAAEIIVNHISATELLEWVRIYEEEIKTNELTRKTALAYARHGQSPHAESFARIYSFFMEFPADAEATFPKASNFIKNLIGNYSGAEQLDLINSAIERARTQNKILNTREQQLREAHPQLRYNGPRSARWAFGTRLG